MLPGYETGAQGLGDVSPVRTRKLQEGTDRWEISGWKQWAWESWGDWNKGAAMSWLAAHPSLDQPEARPAAAEALSLVCLWA